MAARRKTQPRKIPKQSRSKEMVAAIVEAATRILTAEGFEGTNVNRVAELAGVSVGSLYQYYPSKEALVGAVAEKLGAETAALVRQRMTALEDEAPRDAIRGVIACVVDAYRLNPRLRRVICEDVPEAVPHFATPDFDAEIRATIVAYLHTHRAVLRPADLEAAVDMLFTTVEAVCAQTAWSSHPVGAELAVMLERYLLVDP